MIFSIKIYTFSLLDRFIGGGLNWENRLPHGCAEHFSSLAKIWTFWYEKCRYVLLASFRYDFI
jgi:hypothetical protein